MDKMKFETPDITAHNIEKIGALFPNCITEAADENGSVKKAINFELLKQMLSADVVDGDEAYEFTWVGKKAAIVEANRPIRKTLRPCKEESVDWDTTENLYIEGDNLEVLKLLQESYLGKVKMIYIDPPYNTGNDFIYADDFVRSQKEENEQMGMYDEDENRLFKNNDSNGRFHSDWCSMIYSRLMLARNLLTDDGVIFISIDDNELENLKKMCDEIFGEDQFKGQVTRVTGTPTGQGTDSLVKEADYILIYSKTDEYFFKGIPFSAEDEKIYNKTDELGAYLVRPLRKTGGEDRREDRPSMYYGLTAPDGTIIHPVAPSGYASRWRCGENHYKELEARNLIEWKNVDGVWKVYQKFYLEGRVKQVSNLWSKLEGNKKATIEVKNLVGNGVFDFPKPVQLIIQILQISCNKQDIILDFFSGSATTAHAVMQLNAEDGGHRKFIMVQLPEPCNEKSEAYKAGYKTICEIGKERIRRAGKKILDEHPDVAQTLDTGFRVFKVDDSNMKDVYYSAGAYTQDLLSLMESNIKEDRTDLDLFFGCLLDWGLPLSMSYCSETIEKCTVHNYNDGDLMACFDENISDSVIKAIANRQPLRAVFRDSSFADSPSKINVFEVFKLLAPNTQVKVI